MTNTELIEKIKKLSAEQAEKKAAERKAAMERIKKMIEAAKEKSGN